MNFLKNCLCTYIYLNNLFWLFLDTVCNECCGFGPDCRPNDGSCIDPNCIYSTSCSVGGGSGTYSELQPFKIVQSDPLYNQNGAYDGTGSMYSQFASSYSQQLQQSYGVTDSLSLNNDTVNNVHSTHKNSIGSLDTSGYISPANDVYLQQPSYKIMPSMSTMSLRPHVESNYAANGISYPSQSLSVGYLSPELMNFEECDSAWLNRPNVM